jgi:hypothetical protein
VTVPEWGGAVVWVRRLSLTDRLTFETVNGAFEDADRKTNPAKYNRWVIRYVIATACRENGQALFLAEDEDILATKSATALERLMLAAVRVNVVTAEELADLGKSSSGAKNGALPSASPVTSD